MRPLERTPIAVGALLLQAAPVAQQEPSLSSWRLDEMRERGDCAYMRPDGLQCFCDRRDVFDRMPGPMNHEQIQPGEKIEIERSRIGVPWQYDARPAASESPIERYDDCAAENGGPHSGTQHGNDLPTVRRKAPRDSDSRDRVQTVLRGSSCKSEASRASARSTSASTCRAAGRFAGAPPRPPFLSSWSRHRWKSGSASCNSRVIATLPA